ncbi:MAG: hypothetical protein ACRYFX_30100 [Janthinobacterium lividum]
MPTILLASVLKPVDDPRMRGKFAPTLAAAGVRVAVAGRAGTLIADERITQHPIFHGSRLSWGRLVAHWRYWRLLHRLQPVLVVVHAPELLPLTLLWQRLGRGRRFGYDIRENYALNVSTQRVYRGLVRRGLAAGLRWVESAAACRAEAVLLAEASYADELPFLRPLPAGRVLLLENKYQPAPTETLPRLPRPLPSPTEPLRLLYSGTISELNGIGEALALAEELHRRRPGGVVLTVAGFCQQPAVLARLLALVAQRQPWLRLLGGAELVPHATIVAEIAQAHLGLALYRPHPSTARCRPTKLFEYLAYSLPVLVPANPLWASLVQQHDAGLVVADTTPAALAEQVLAATAPGSQGFYRQGLPTDVLWADEGKKLGHLLESLGVSPTFAA